MTGERRRSTDGDPLDLTEADSRDRAGDERDRAAVLRDDAGDRRDVLADRRDSAGDVRDVAADIRDLAGDARDAAADARDRGAAQRMHLARVGEPLGHESPGEARLAAASDRVHSAQDRLAAAGERSQAEQDRRQALVNRSAGADGRIDAEHDRDNALADRIVSERNRRASSLDALTGAYLRGAGVLALDREIARVRRQDQQLMVAFVDIDGLKSMNDTRGHAAGDQLLIAVADTLRSRLRSYDVVVRYGGDEFVGVAAGLEPDVFRNRFSVIHDDLVGIASISVGFAELVPGDTSNSILARADAAMYLNRRDRAARSGALRAP